jgi:hypothetical protein
VELNLALDEERKATLLCRDREWCNRLEIQETIPPGSPEIELHLAFYARKYQREPRPEPPGEEELAIALFSKCSGRPRNEWTPSTMHEARELLKWWPARRGGGEVSKQ